MSYLKEALKIVNDRDPLKEVTSSLNEAVGRLLSFKNPIAEVHHEEKELKDVLSPQELALAKKLASEEGGDLMNDHKELYDKLYDFFVFKMPMGIAKAREGDPDQWILDHLEDYL